jgi:putative acetyltransferase
LVSEQFVIIIRIETPDDILAIREVNEQAFGRSDEADLVDALRIRGAITLSLVADLDRIIVGHILFSPVSIESDTGSTVGIALAPMAVLPEFQRQGIGSQLINTGLDQLSELGHSLVVVLGHPGYYPRFGFTPSKPHDIIWNQDIPEEVFMVKELQPGTLQKRKGIVRFQPEFKI